jgi:hypothetical protein
MYAVAVGNPFDGVTLFGPFYNSEEADEWGESVQDDWWVVEILTIEEG